jgi:hypothetical protein
MDNPMMPSAQPLIGVRPLAEGTVTGVAASPCVRTEGGVLTVAAMTADQLCTVLAVHAVLCNTALAGVHGDCDQAAEKAIRECARVIRSAAGINTGLADAATAASGGCPLPAGA